MIYGPPPRRALSLLAGVLASVAAAFFIPEFGALAAVLGAWLARDLWFRQTLELRDAGFRYVAGLHRHYAPWTSVDNVRVRQERHFLAFGRMLEIDLHDDTLIVLSGLQLGAEPDEVAAIVEARWHEAINAEKRS